MKIYKYYLFFFLCLLKFGNAYCQDIDKQLSEAYEHLKNNEYDATSKILVTIDKGTVEQLSDSLKLIYYESQGILCVKTGKYSKAIQPLLVAVDLYEQLNIRYQNYLDCIFAIAFSYDKLQDKVNAEKYYRKALINSGPSNAQNLDYLRSNIYINLGNIYQERGDSLLATECYQRVRTSDPFELIEANDINWLGELWRRANEFREQKKYEETVNIYDTIIKKIKMRYGTNNTEYVFASYSKGLLLRLAFNDYKKAAEIFLEIIGKKNFLSDTNEWIAGSYCNYALCESYLNDFVTVEDLLPEAIEYIEKLQNDVYLPQTIYRFIGNGAFWSTNYEKSILYYEKYLLGKIKENGNSYKEITNQLGVSYIFDNQVQNAEKLYITFLSENEEEMITVNDPLLPTIYHNLGRSIMLQGRKEDALEYLNKSSRLQISLYGEISERTQQYINECKK